MKFSIRSSLVLIAGCVFFVGLGSSDAVAGKIPLQSLAGTFTLTGGGSFAVCTGPAPTFTEIACSSFVEGTDFFFPQTMAEVGIDTVDAQGNSCATGTETVSDFPVDFSPPEVTTFNSVSHLKDYDPSTGVGDATGTSYTGGSCNGAVFNSSGATEISTFMAHFVASDNGKRLDYLITALQDPVGGIGDFSLTFTALARP